MPCAKTGRSSRFLRDDREEEREDIPLLGEDMPVKRHVLFFLADGVSGDGDDVFVSRADVGELGDGIESFGDDVSGDEEAIQDERVGNLCPPPTSRGGRRTVRRHIRRSVSPVARHAHRFGVVSPLLSNMYLHLLDRSFRKRVERGELQGRLVRYCDDFVLLTRHRPDKELSWLHAFLARLGLTLHPDKTRMVNTWKTAFDFLGYRVARPAKKLVLDISPKSRVRIHGCLRKPSRRTFQTLEHLVAELNEYIRGARQYFRLAPWWSRRALDSYVEGRIARWFRRKLGQKYPAWSRVSEHKIHREYGVLAWAPVQPWGQLTACTRR